MTETAVWNPADEAGVWDAAGGSVRRCGPWTSSSSSISWQARGKRRIQGPIPDLPEPDLHVRKPAGDLWAHGCLRRRARRGPVARRFQGWEARQLPLPPRESRVSGKVMGCSCLSTTHTRVHTNTCACICAYAHTPYTCTR